MNSLCQWFITTSKSISKQSDSSIIEGLCAESPSSENPPHKMFPQEIETESINLLKMSITVDIKRRRGMRKGKKSSTCLLFGAAQEERPRAPWKSSFMWGFRILALKVTFYLGFVWDLQRPPASKGCACITALSSSSNQITAWVSFFLFLILLET